MFERKNSKAAKLTLEQVQDIREHYANGATQGSLCRYYGVTIGTIGRIVRGETWTGGAAVGKGTQADIDASLARLQALTGAGSIAEIQGAVERGRALPPSLLDGGDVASEGEGLSELQRRARAYGAGDSMVEELAKGGPLDE